MECGLFSLVGSTNIGDKFDEIKRNSVTVWRPVVKGVPNFKNSPPKKTQGILSLYANDPYVDKIKYYRQKKNEAAKKYLNPKGFRCTSPMKASSSQGDYYGTFQVKPFEYKNDGLYQKKYTGKLPLDTVAVKQFTTSPIKNGRANATPGLLIGEKTPEYIQTPFSGPHDAMRKEEEEEKAKRGALFKTMSPEREFFDTTKCGSSKIFHDDKYMIPMFRKKDRAKTANSEEGKRLWTPGTVLDSKLGLFSTINYEPPYSENQKTRVMGNATDTEYETWRPTSPNKSYYITGHLMQKPLFVASVGLSRPGTVESVAKKE